MTPKELIRFYCGIPETAKAMRISEQAVKNWLKAGQIGWMAQQLAEHLTIGLLKAKRPKRKANRESKSCLNH